MSSSRKIAAALSQPNPTPTPVQPLLDPKHMASLIFAGTTVGLPIDTALFALLYMKTIKQTQEVAKDEVRQLKGFRHAFSTIYREQGVKGFYKGFSPTFIASIPGTTLFFGAKEGIQNYYENNKAVFGDSRFMKWAVQFLAGLGAQVAGSLVWVTADVFRERIQITVKNPEFKNLSVTGLAANIIKREGVRGLYRGFLPQLASFGSFNALGNVLSSGIIERFSEVDRKGEGYNFIGNLVGYGLSAGITNPIDVVKVRVQVSEASPGKFPYTSKQMPFPTWMPMLNCVAHTYKTEGLRAFKAGAAERMAWLGLRQGGAMTLFPLAYKYASKKLAEQSKPADEVTRKNGSSLSK